MNSEKDLKTIERELSRRRTEHHEGRTSHRTLRLVFRRFLAFLALIFLAGAGIFLFNFFRLNSNLVEGHIKQYVIPQITGGKFPLLMGRASGDLITGVEIQNLVVQNPFFQSGGALLNIPRVTLRYSLLDVFFGQLVLEKLSIESPVLVLSRNADSRGIWDFSSPDDAAASATPEASGPNSQARPEVDSQARVEAMADRYLRRIEIIDLTIILPRPRDLFPDRTIARLLGLPEGNLHIPGIHVLLQKFPHGVFSTHVLRLSTPTDPKLALFQWNREKQTGNFDLSFDALKTKIVVGVRNLGLEGRKIVIADEHDRNRLNLTFGLTHENVRTVQRIIGLSGKAVLKDLSILTRFLPADTRLSGGLEMSFQPKDDKTPLLDTRINGNISSLTLVVPEITPINHLDLDFSLADRLAEIRHLFLDMGGFVSRHQGSVFFQDFANVTGSLSSDLSGEKMLISGSMKQETPDLSRVQIQASRDAGNVQFQALHRQAAGINRYENISFTGRVGEGKYIADLVPAKLLSKSLAESWNSWNSRVDLVGPVEISGDLPTTGTFREARASIVLKKAALISKLDKNDRAVLEGSLTVASNTLTLLDLSSTIDSLRFLVNGEVKTDALMKKVKEYKLIVSCQLETGKPFNMTGQRLQHVFGLKKTPPFDQISLEGEILFRSNLSSVSEPQTGSFDIAKVRLKRGKKSWWLDNLKVDVATEEPLDACRFKPGSLTASLSGNFFGFPVKSSATLNIASHVIHQLDIQARGSDFSVLMTALRDHPDVDAFLKKQPMNLSGAFNLALSGKGEFRRPSLTGKLTFPSLNFRMDKFGANFPFGLTITSAAEGEYRGEMVAQSGRLRVRDLEFALEKFSGSLGYSCSKSAKENAVQVKVFTTVFGTNFTFGGRYFPKANRLESGIINAKSKVIQTLANEIGKMATLKLPFTIKGNFESETRLSGPLEALRSEGFIDLEDLGLKFPLKTLLGGSSLDIDAINGRFDFQQKDQKRIDGEIQNVRARLLGAPLEISGRIHLDKEATGFIPALDDLSASVNSLSAAALHKFIQSGIVPGISVTPFQEVVGNLTGKLTISGRQNRFSGTGDLAVTGGGFRYAGLKEPVKNLSGKLQFSRRLDRPEPIIGIQGLTASFGRAKIAIPNGQIIDPQKSGKVSMDGAVDSAFPTEILALLSSLKLPTITFPREGPFFGKIVLSGTLANPRIEARIDGSETEVCYISEGNRYTIPLGKSSLNFRYDCGTGQLQVPESTLRFLKGELQVKNGTGRFSGGKPISFSAKGSFKDIDLGSLGTKGGPSAQGILSGDYSADQTEKGTREAVALLKIKNLVLLKIPVDPETIKQIGLDSLEEPEFRVGQVNLYLSSDGDIAERGRLRLADALFAGPDLRLEISESSFDPKNLQLTGKIMFNPQPLRKTKLGKKLGNLTRVLQDKETGIPFLDISVNGTWDNPSVMKSAITDRAKKRGKRNYIKSIFGGRRSHKASVEELMQWFPGWAPGQ